jgi:hypothetical protein
MRVLLACARAIAYLRSQVILDFYLSLDSITLSILGDIKITDYCIKQKPGPRNQSIAKFMLSIYEECLSPNNFTESAELKSIQETQYWDKYKSLKEMHTLLSSMLSS